MEKSLPLANGHPSSTHVPGSRYASTTRNVIAGTLKLVLLLGALYLTFFSPLYKTERPHGSKKHVVDQCVQPNPIFPIVDSEELKQVFEFVSSEGFKNESSLRLSGAVQVKTESFDDLGAIGEDARWEVFYGFHKYLEKAYPLTHKSLKLEKVNTHGLLYTWLGSDETLKPTLLMAHQDVVPVNPAVADTWTYPPYSGYIDGKSIWGRGASDCKNQLTAILETTELLLKAKFEPKRTIILSFGFDEECSGRQGAGHLAPFILDRYGKDGIAAIVDEGMGYAEQFGRGFAAPGVAEKGYTDVDITVKSPGGHSSIPRDHTSIGILSELITHIEAEKYPTYLHDTNPLLGFLSCSAEYAPDFPKKLRHLLHDRQTKAQPTCAMKKHHDALAIEVAKLGPSVRYLMQTSQAVDLISGGVKINAMPELATATVNHRINIGDTPEDVWHHIAHLAAPVAKKYNLTLHAFDNTTADAAEALSLTLTARKTVLRTAPVTPTNVDALTPYAVIAGTIRALYGEDMVVAPAIMTGNTDTRYYWDLSPHIFRFGPGMIADDQPGIGNIHTVDESVSIANHVASVKWFMLFVRNMDELNVE